MTGGGRAGACHHSVQGRELDWPGCLGLPASGPQVHNLPPTVPAATRCLPAPQAHRRAEQQHHEHHGGGGGVWAALGSTLRAVRILMRSPLFKRLTLCMMLTGVSARAGGKGGCSGLGAGLGGRRRMGGGRAAARSMQHAAPPKVPPHPDPVQSFHAPSPTLAPAHLLTSSVPMLPFPCALIPIRLCGAPLAARAPTWHPSGTCPMRQVVLEGLQDLLVQYLQLKMDFGVADVVRACGGGGTLPRRLGGSARSWARGGGGLGLPRLPRVRSPRWRALTGPPPRTRTPPHTHPAQSRIFQLFGGCGLLVQTLLLRALLGCARLGRSARLGGAALGWAGRRPVQPQAPTTCAPRPARPPARSWLGEQRVLLVALAASTGQQLILALAGAKWVAFLGISLGSLGAWAGSRARGGPAVWRACSAAHA